MKQILFALAVAAVVGLAWAETKTWPEGYSIETMTEAQIPEPADPGTFGLYEAERVEMAKSLTTLDTFLFAIFDAQGSLTGLSTMAPGALLFLR